MKYGLIYIATSPDGDSYIGKTSRTLEERRKEHEQCNLSTKFSKALKEYGTRNFSWKILENNISEDVLDAREKYYIKSLHPLLNEINYIKKNKINVIKGKAGRPRKDLFENPKMLMARIPSSLFFEFKQKLKEDNINLQTFVNILVKSVNEGLVEVK